MRAAQLCILFDCRNKMKAEMMDVVGFMNIYNRSNKHMNCGWEKP